MGELKDIEKLHRQIIHNKVTPRNLFHLFHNLATISAMYDKMKTDKTLMTYVVSELENKKRSYDLEGKQIPDICDLCKRLQDYIESHLVLEKCFSIDNMNYEEIDKVIEMGKVPSIKAIVVMPANVTPKKTDDLTVEKQVTSAMLLNHAECKDSQVDVVVGDDQVFVSPCDK